MKQRQIKFMVWESIGRRMYTDSYMRDVLNYDDLLLNGAINWHVLQFAGFYAKDEREIYEGDIINFGGYNLAVVFQKGEFVGKFKEEIEDETIPGFIIRHEADKFEIVGNVFENLDLVSSTSILPKKS